MATGLDTGPVVINVPIDGAIGSAWARSESLDALLPALHHDDRVIPRQAACGRPPGLITVP